MKNKIIIVTVNFGLPDSTLQLINSIPINNNLKIWIEDNQATENSIKELSDACYKIDHNLSIYHHKKNWYYWGAFNQAYQRILNSDLEIPKWLIICNNDIIFNQKFFVELEKINPKTDHIIAPSIYSGNSKKKLNPFFQSPLGMKEKIYYKLLYTHPSLGRIIQLVGKHINNGIKIINKSRITEPNRIYAPHGSCIVFSSEYFKKGGYIDTGFKLFGEELSTAEIARKIGCNIYYHPQLSVIHNEHHSTKQFTWEQLYSMSKETYNYLNNQYKF